MRTKLVLNDGTAVEGSLFGSPRVVCGEVVFNTGMTGYMESLTDPSYAGQILVLTYPLVGNYGVPEPRGVELLAPPYESDRIQVQGLVVQHYVDEYLRRHYGSPGRSMSSSSRNTTPSK
jgi:carbamoyl-phosphate synthase small subunit